MYGTRHFDELQPGPIVLEPDRVIGLCELEVREQRSHPPVGFYDRLDHLIGAWRVAVDRTADPCTHPGLGLDQEARPGLDYPALGEGLQKRRDHLQCSAWRLVAPIVGELRQKQLIDLDPALDDIEFDEKLAAGPQQFEIRRRI